MLPEQTEISRCSHCAKLYWVKDARVIGEYDWFKGKDELPEEWKGTQSVQHLDISGFKEALAGEFGKSRYREKHLRIQLWWALNDLIRQGAQVDIFLQYKDLFYSNLGALEELLQNNDTDDKIMQAEIARELGKFEECLERLSNIPDERGSIRDQIKELAQRKNQIVQELQAIE